VAAAGCIGGLALRGDWGRLAPLGVRRRGAGANRVAFIFVIAVGVLLLVLWNAAAWPQLGPAAETTPEDVSILIPARDEAANIVPCLEALRGQAGVREILVYDDESRDGTPDQVRRLASGWPRVRLIGPEPLPEGWTGKTHACARLADAATGRWLLFLDADARLARDAVARIRAEAERRQATLLSCWPGLEMHGFWERALMPLLNFVVFTLYPAPLAFRMQLPSLGLAHGACVLCRRDAYLRIGGHARVRGELFEDTALARAWRAAGEVAHCVDGQSAVRTRMYDSFSSIWRGFQKNIYPAFRRELSFWLFWWFHAAVFVAPFAAVVVAPTAAAWGAAACAWAARGRLARRFRQPAWSVALHPLAEALMLALALVSWHRCRTGHGVEWKGRRWRGR